eukprot:6434356-Amphidinium_carterae.1
MSSGQGVRGPSSTNPADTIKSASTSKCKRVLDLALTSLVSFKIACDGTFSVARTALSPKLTRIRAPSSADASHSAYLSWGCMLHKFSCLWSRIKTLNPRLRCSKP